MSLTSLYYEYWIFLLRYDWNPLFYVIQKIKKKKKLLQKFQNCNIKGTLMQIWKSLYMFVFM